MRKSIPLCSWWTPLPCVYFERTHWILLMTQIQKQIYPVMLGWSFYRDVLLSNIAFHAEWWSLVHRSSKHFVLLLTYCVLTDLSKASYSSRIQIKLRGELNDLRFEYLFFDHSPCCINTLSLCSVIITCLSISIHFLLSGKINLTWRRTERCIETETPKS